MLRGFVDQNHKPPQLPFRRDVVYYTAFVLFPPALRLQTKLHRLYSCQVVASLRYYRSCIAFSFSMHLLLFENSKRQPNKNHALGEDEVPKKQDEAFFLCWLVSFQWLI